MRGVRACLTWLRAVWGIHTHSNAPQYPAPMQGSQGTPGTLLQDSAHLSKTQPTCMPACTHVHPSHTPVTLRCYLHTPEGKHQQACLRHIAEHTRNQCQHTTWARLRATHTNHPHHQQQQKRCCCHWRPAPCAAASPCAPALYQHLAAGPWPLLLLLLPSST